MFFLLITGVTGKDMNPRPRGPKTKSFQNLGKVSAASLTGRPARPWCPKEPPPDAVYSGA